MHPVPVALKRAFHRTLDFSRRFAKILDTTPARADLVRVISERQRVPQCQLPEILGVSRATISRMLIALEKLGLIVRTPMTTERGQPSKRLLLVALSSAGQDLAHAISHSLSSPWFQTVLEERARRFGSEVGAAVDTLHTTIKDLARFFGDRSVDLHGLVWFVIALARAGSVLTSSAQVHEPFGFRTWHARFNGHVRVACSPEHDPLRRRIPWPAFVREQTSLRDVASCLVPLRIPMAA